MRPTQLNSVTLSMSTRGFKSYISKLGWQPRNNIIPNNNAKYITTIGTYFKSLNQNIHIDSSINNFEKLLTFFEPIHACIVQCNGVTSCRYLKCIFVILVCYKIYIMGYARGNIFMVKTYLSTISPPLYPVGRA